MTQIGIEVGKSVNERLVDLTTRTDETGSYVPIVETGEVLFKGARYRTLAEVKAEAESHSWYGEPDDFRAAVQAVEAARRTAPVDLSSGLRRLISAFINLNFDRWRRIR